MFYNDNKLKITDFEKGKSFGEALKKSNYRFLYNSIIGSLVSIDFWKAENEVLELLNGISGDEQELIKYFVLCYPIEEKIILKKLGQKSIDFLIESGLANKVDTKLIPNGYAILPVNDLYLILSLPNFYSNSKSKFTDIYIGQDSARLGQMINKRDFNRVLDLCAGSGIQGMNLIDNAEEINAVEMNDTAFIAAKLNQMINNIPENVYQIYKGDLYNVLGEKVYDCIISNPPYVPSPKNIELPMCGAGGEDGMKIARRIVDGYETHLAENGRAYMVLECIGDEEKPYIIDYLYKKIGKGIINASLINRQPIEFQSAASAELTTRFYDDPENYVKYKKIWDEMFRKQSVEYIYPVVIEYIKEDCPLTLNIVHNYLKWNTHSKFIFNNIDKKIESIEYYKIRAKDNEIKYVKRDFMDLLLENQGKSVCEIVKEENCSEQEYCRVLEDYIRRLMLLEQQHILERR